MEEQVTISNYDKKLKLEMKHARKILLTCTNDAGSNYGHSGSIDVKTHSVNENFQLLP